MRRRGKSRKRKTRLDSRSLWRIQSTSIDPKVMVMRRFSWMSRREFLLLSSVAFAPLGAGSMAKTSTAASTSGEVDSGGEVPRSEPPLSFQECPECGGLGRITCPACDGTGMWTEASESAGTYLRESARASGHCAWCDEWGEAACLRCEGVGLTESCHSSLTRPCF